MNEIKTPSISIKDLIPTTTPLIETSTYTETTPNINPGLLYPCEPDISISGETTTSPTITTSEFKLCEYGEDITDFGPDLEDVYSGKRPVLSIDKAYFFKFHSDIASLNNLYKVKGILSYSEVDDMISDPVGYLYEAAGKSALYVQNNMMFDFRYQVHYKLSLISDPTIIYFVPESLLNAFPAADYKPYSRYLITIDVGVIPFKEEIDAAILKLKSLTDGLLGVRAQVVATSYSSSWLNEEQINYYNESRKHLKTQKSDYLDSKKLKLENDNLVARLALYEEYLIDVFNACRDYLCKKEICAPEVFVEGQTTTSPLIRTTPYMECQTDSDIQSSIVTPIIISPSTNSINLPTTLTIEASPMRSIPENSLGYGTSLWEIATSSTFVKTSIVQELTTDSNILELKNLNPGTTYWVRLKHKDLTDGYSSSFSLAVKFTTKEASPRPVLMPPSLLNVPDGGVVTITNGSLRFTGTSPVTEPTATPPLTSINWYLYKVVNNTRVPIREAVTDVQQWLITDLNGLDDGPYVIGISYVAIDDFDGERIYLFSEIGFTNFTLTR